MALEFEVMSRAIGSNPGGKCIYKEGCDERMVYLKHCVSSRVSSRDSSFVFPHQPVYEAVTFEMARKIGLHTPFFYVVLNEGNDVNFHDGEGVKSKIKPKQSCYFASDILPILRGDIELEEEKVKRESIYRDLLQVSDIVGRGQNYFLDRFKQKLFYLDLGCSFVDAHEGFIQLKTSHPDILNKKMFKRFMKKLSRYSLICNDNETLLGLDEFVRMPYEITIPTLNPKGRRRLDTLISEEEVDEIVNRLASGIVKCKLLKKNGESEFLVKA